MSNRHSIQANINILEFCIEILETKLKLFLFHFANTSNAHLIYYNTFQVSQGANSFTISTL